MKTQTRPTVLRPYRAEGMRPQIADAEALVEWDAGGGALSLVAVRLGDGTTVRWTEGPTAESIAVAVADRFGSPASDGATYSATCDAIAVIESMANRGYAIAYAYTSTDAAQRAVDAAWEFVRAW